MKQKLIIGGSLCLLVYLFVFVIIYKEAATVEGFPVSRFAELKNIPKVDKYEQYQWKSASEENGLPALYLLMIKLKGWRELERMGSVTVFEKDGRRVEVNSQTNYLSIIPNKQDIK